MMRSKLGESMKKLRRFGVENVMIFSVQPLRPLCLCGSFPLVFYNHRDTEDTEVPQRKRNLVD